MLCERSVNETVIQMEGPAPNVWEGEILTDTTKTRWQVGKFIAAGGFGQVHLASNKIEESVHSDADYIVKFEPLKNGSLTTEIEFYRTFAIPEMIEQYESSRVLQHLGLSKFIASGSHVYRKEKYLFLVLDRHGQDLDELFSETERFPVKTVCYLGIQILDILEYIHSHGVVHADIKGPNLLLGNRKGSENCVYLLDFGLACSYVSCNGVHKKYAYDQRKAHIGTLEYVSRDAHIGAFSRRGDLESLGYNMLQWLCGELPWQEIDDPECNRIQKNNLMSNIPLFMRQCFNNSEPPAMLMKYFKYVASLNFQTRPSYAYCRNLLKQGVEDSGCVDDGKLVFEDNPFPLTIENQIRGNKRRATEDPESAELQPKKRIHSTPEKLPASNKMITMLDDPEVEIQERAKLDRKPPAIIPAKYEPVVLVQRLKNEVIKKYSMSSRRVLKPKIQRQQKADASLLLSSIPTKTMLNITLNPLPVIVEQMPRYEVWCM
jgi:vaccinia related kinase